MPRKLLNAAEIRLMWPDGSVVQAWREGDKVVPMLAKATSRRLRPEYVTAMLEHPFWTNKTITNCEVIREPKPDGGWSESLRFRWSKK